MSMLNFFAKQTTKDYPDDKILAADKKKIIEELNNDIYMLIIMKHKQQEAIIELKEELHELQTQLAQTTAKCIIATSELESKRNKINKKTKKQFYLE